MRSNARHLGQHANQYADHPAGRSVGIGTWPFGHGVKNSFDGPRASERASPPAREHGTGARGKSQKSAPSLLYGDEAHQVENLTKPSMMPKMSSISKRRGDGTDRPPPERICCLGAEFQSSFALCGAHNLNFSKFDSRAPEDIPSSSQVAGQDAFSRWRSHPPTISFASSFIA